GRWVSTGGIRSSAVRIGRRRPLHGPWLAAFRTARFHATGSFAGELMFVLGLTGSVGMGKSTAARFFAEAGVPVHDADASVHRLYEKDAVGPIGAAFPAAIVAGRVDRTRLAAEVLGHPEAMRRLEGIVHPLVRASEQRF